MNAIKNKNIRFLKRLMKMGTKKTIFLFTNGGIMDNYSLVAVERDDGTKNVIPVTIFIEFFKKGDPYGYGGGLGGGLLHYTNGTGYFTSHDDFSDVIEKILRERKISVRERTERYWINGEKVTDY